jgi:hypothetical protein
MSPGKQRSTAMDREIDPAIVKQWIAEAKAAVKEFLEDCDNIEYAADTGINIMGFASAQSALLQQRFRALEKRAEVLRYSALAGFQVDQDFVAAALARHS